MPARPLGAPAAVMNAVVNAPAPLGVTDPTMPGAPGKVWRAVQRHRKPMAA